MTDFDPETPSNRLLLPETARNSAEQLGRMQTAVEADLAHMEALDKGVRGSLAALARELARALDATGDDKPTPAQVGQLGQQLRTTLLALDNVASDSGAAEAFFRIMREAVGEPHEPSGGTAIRDPKDTEPENTRPPRRTNRGATGKTPDAMAENGGGHRTGDRRRRAPRIPLGDSGSDEAERED